jgi:hypothetical protein
MPDIVLQKTIPSAKVAEAKLGLEAGINMPMTGGPDNPTPMFDNLKDLVEWDIGQHLKARYRQGKRKLASEAAIIDDILE